MAIVSEGEGVDGGVQVDCYRHDGHDENGNHKSWELALEGLEVTGEKVDDMRYNYRPGEEHDIWPDVEHLWNVDADDMIFLVACCTSQLPRLNAESRIHLVPRRR